MSIVQIGLIGVVATILSLQFRDKHKEYALIIGLVVSVVIFFSIITKLEIIVEAIDEIQTAMGIEVEYIAVLLKMLGITYISELSSSICKDAGYGSIATQIELFGKVTILALSTPILLALLETIGLFLS